MNRITPLLPSGAATILAGTRAAGDDARRRCGRHWRCDRHWTSIASGVPNLSAARADDGAIAAGRGLVRVAPSLRPQLFEHRRRRRRRLCAAGRTHGAVKRMSSRNTSVATTSSGTGGGSGGVPVCIAPGTRRPRS
jgi:hypothetical protein